MAEKSNVAAGVLRTLHRIHRQLTDLRGRQELGPRKIRVAENGVAQREKELAEAQAELKRLRVVADQKQLNLKTGENKVKDLKAKLNAAQSNREYQALKDQIAADEMANSVVADEVLETLELIDKAQADVGEVEKNVAAAKRKVEEVRAEAVAAQPLIQADIDRLEGELAETESQLPPDTADLYRRLVRLKGEDGLAPIENQICGGCCTQVPLNVYSQVLLGTPIFCKTCGRLLYTPETEK